jgi:hypothetical protein
MKSRFTFLFSLLLLTANSQTSFSPENVLGYKIGAQFTRHEKVVNYFDKLQSAFPKQVRINPYGQTNEKRDLFFAIIASEENFKRIEEIRLNHLKNSTEENVAIVWLSYNVHGNESSGTEAAMQTAYELLTQQKELLKNTIVIIDPCLNPDGRERYVNFYNQYGSTPVNSNRISADHNEPWPGGRANHYLFDLNRDWAWLTQIESKQRIKAYNLWLPHVHVDFHEQAINEPYYFPPAAEPYHEVITKWQREFQKEIGKNHAKYFDKAGWLYFSKEIFDLLYPSYGDTYPTYNGAIGMTYEQGGSGRAGLSVLTNTGDTLTLYDRVEHHVTTGISTVEVSSDKYRKLIEEYQQFATKKKFTYQSYLLDGNAPNLGDLLKLMDQHEISYSHAIPNISIKGFDYFTSKEGNYKTKEGDVIISTNQIKGTFINVLFEPKTELSDSLTYDLTAWSLPYAYGISTVASSTLLEGKTYANKAKENQLNETNYAYLCQWNNLNSAKFLTRLLNNNILVSFSESSFEINKRSYEKGTLIITRGQNKQPDFDKLIVKYANESGVELHSISSGMVDKGKDLGSSLVKNIPRQRIGVLIGAETSSLSAGEIWHFFEQEIKLGVSLIMEEDLSSALDEIDVLFIPEGDYTPDFSVNNWVDEGGKLIVMGNAAASFVNHEIYGLDLKKEELDTLNKTISYENTERNEISNTIAGAIYACELDNSNPLCFGYTQPYFTLRLTPELYTLKDGTHPFTIKTNDALIAGFSGAYVKNKQASAIITGIESKGKGCVIYLLDNPLFRGFWQNGKLQIMNAIYFVNQQ